MSNYLAIASVTASLQSIVADAVSVVSGTRVLAARPQKDDADAAAPRVNIFLYAVVPHAAYRATDSREQAAVDLQFLLTFAGDEKRFEPQLLLGRVVRQLHEEPVLTPERVRGAERREPYATAAAGVASDLALQEEPVRITPLAPALEDFTKLWSTFGAIPYAVSIAYQAGVVLIDRIASGAQEEQPWLQSAAENSGTRRRRGPQPITGP